MTQEQKGLLLRDLSARLQYGVIIEHKGNLSRLDTIFMCDSISISSTSIDKESFYNLDLDEVKPYLFPLSSMTEEQRIKLYKVLGWGYESHYHLLKEWEDFNESIDNNDLFLPASWISDLNKMYNWLNENHFDYRGLIPMSLANDATGLNIY